MFFTDFYLMFISLASFPVSFFLSAFSVSVLCFSLFLPKKRRCFLRLICSHKAPFGGSFKFSSLIRHVMINGSGFNNHSKIFLFSCYCVLKPWRYHCASNAALLNYANLCLAFSYLIPFKMCSILARCELVIMNETFL